MERVDGKLNWMERRSKWARRDTMAADNGSHDNNRQQEDGGMVGHDGRTVVATSAAHSLPYATAVGLR
jgi:hypothetical protein